MASMPEQQRRPRSGKDRSRYDIERIRVVLPLSVFGLLAVTVGVATYGGMLLGSVDLPVRIATSLTAVLLAVVAIATALNRMEPNVGGIDWWSRVVIGSSLIVIGFVGFGHVWLVIGLFLVIIGVAGFADRRYVIGTVATGVGIIVVAGWIPFALGPLSELFVSLFVVAFGLLAINTAVTRRCPVNLALGIQTHRSD